MKAKTWIPKYLEQVIFKGIFADKIAQVLEFNPNGKYTIRIGLQTSIKDVDISKLEKIAK